MAAADDHCLPVTQHRAVCSTTSVWGWAELHDELSLSLSRAGSNAGNSTPSSLDPTSGPHPAPQRLSKAPSRRPKIVGGVSGSLGSRPAQGGVLGGVLPPPAAAEPRGLLEQTRTVLVPVYGSGCPEFLATMRDTVTAPGLSGEASGCGGVVDTTGGARGAYQILERPHLRTQLIALQKGKVPGLIKNSIHGCQDYTPV